MIRVLSVGIAVVLPIVLMPQGSVPAEAGKKVKSSSAKTGSTGPIVTGRFGLKTYDVSDPAPRAGRKKGKKGN